MSLDVAIQMDPVDAIDINGDSTFAMALEAQARGHSLSFYEPRHLSMRDGRVYAKTKPITLRREMGNHVDIGEERVVDLDSHPSPSGMLMRYPKPRTVSIQSPASRSLEGSRRTCMSTVRV